MLSHSLMTQKGRSMDSPEQISGKEGGNESKFKLIEFFIKRLEHTIRHTQTATKLIYLVNGAILAAIYFGFGKVKPISVSFLVAGALLFLLSIVNFLHANLLAVQNAWYRAIDEEIRNVFLKIRGISDVWPEHLGKSRDRVLDSYNKFYFIFPFRRAHGIFVAIHIVVACFILSISLSFFYFAYFTPNITFG